MNKNLNKIIKISAFIILIIIIGAGLSSENNKKKKFDRLGNEVSSYATNSVDRVNKSVITLPEDGILVGLDSGKGSYESKIQNASGVITLKSEFMKTEFVRGVYKKKDPRLDVAVPMYISTDSYGGSMYLVLFNDRGDVAIEKSFARLGGKNIVLGNINILPGDGDKVEYKVNLIYKSEGLDKSLKTLISKPKEVTIPVVDGHFDPAGTISK